MRKRENPERMQPSAVPAHYKRKGRLVRDPVSGLVVTKPPKITTAEVQRAEETLWDDCTERKMARARARGRVRIAALRRAAGPMLKTAAVCKLLRVPPPNTAKAGRTAPGAGPSRWTGYCVSGLSI